MLGNGLREKRCMSGQAMRHRIPYTLTFIRFRVPIAGSLPSHGGRQCRRSMRRGADAWPLDATWHAMLHAATYSKSLYNNKRDALRTATPALGGH
jgi:hypothetical protein